MRTLENIYIEYCNYVVEKTFDPYLHYRELCKKYRDKDTLHAFLYKEISKLIYDPDRGFYFFCKFILGDLKYAGFPRPFKMSKLIRQWDKILKESSRLALLCARAHGKTMMFSILSNIYYMTIYSHKRIIIISSSQDQANRIVEEIKTIIESNEWLLMKKNKDKWSSSNIGYNGGYIYAAGLGTEILGQHVDKIVIDDCLRSDNKLTDQQIEDYVDMNLEPMLLARGGQMVLVGTPRRPEDLFSIIERRIQDDSNSLWKLYKFPAILNYEKKQLLCPERFTWEELMLKRATMGIAKFNREYQLILYSRDTSVFSAEFINSAKERGKNFVLMDKLEKRTPEWAYYAGVDVARSGSVSADYTVLIILCYNANTQEKQIVGFYRFKGLKISEQAAEIARVINKFNNCPLAVETNNMGQDLVDELTDRYNVLVEPITVSSSAKKEELVRFLIQAFENEQMIIPGGNEYTREQMQILEDELTKYSVVRTAKGNEKYMGRGSHDDVCSALMLANKMTQIYGVPFAIAGSSTTLSGQYSAFTERIRKSDSDIEKLIKLGLIK